MTPSDNRKRQIRRSLQVLTSSAVLLLLFYIVDWDEFFRLAATADWRFAALAGMLALVISGLEGVRMRSAIEGNNPSLTGHLRISLISNAVAQLTIGLLGGDLYRVHALRKYGLPLAEIGTGVVFARIAGLFANAALVAFAMAMLLWTGNLPERSNLLMPIIAVALLTGIVIAVGLILLNRKLAGQFHKPGDKDRNGLFARLALIGAGLTPAKTTKVLLWSFVVVLVRGALLWAATAMLTEPPNIQITMLIAGMGVFASVIPIGLAGWGIKEGVIAGLFVFFGMETTLAISIAIVARMVPILILSPLAAIILLWRPRSAPVHPV